MEEDGTPEPTPAGAAVVAYGPRVAATTATRVTEDRVTKSDPLALTRDDDTRDETGGGGGRPIAVTLPSPFPATLNAKLTPVAQPHMLRAAVDVVSSLSPFKGMAFALVDLSTSGVRNYAGSHDTEQRFIASTAKLAILFAAFQLRKAMREAGALVTDKKVTKDTELFDTILRQWRPKIAKYFRGGAPNDAYPSLAQIFAATQRSTGGWDVDFATTPRGGTGRAFTVRLENAVLNSDDNDAGTCILDLGFPYIHGAISEAGLWSRGKGLRVSLNYAGTFWDPAKKFDETPQASTARALAEFMTLLEMDELVPGTRDEMRAIMSGVRNAKYVGVISYLATGVVKATTKAQHATLDVVAKVGYTGDDSHCDAGVVRHESQAGDVRYAVVILNAHTDAVAIEAFRALDVALVASRLPPPPP